MLASKEALLGAFCREAKRLLKWAVVIGGLAWLLVLAACASTGRIESTQKINWDDPFGGDEVASVTEAAALLKIDPVLPSGLAPPSHIYIVTGGEPADPRLVLTYNDKTYGRFLVDESTAQTDQNGLEGQARAISSEIVTLKSGTRALIVAGPTSNGILWLRDGVLFDLYGPPDTFSVDDAIAVADLIEAPG